jgi:phage shock protein PspC (stress-responsive transcriptional regulator)
MLGMDEQTPPPGPGGTTTDEGPRVTREQVVDVTRLRRSSTDRYVAGVAGGLGRHLDVDPLLVRVVLAVLTLFGAAGVLIYVAVWLLVPEDGSERAPIRLGADAVRAILLGVLVVAALLVLGIPWGDPGWALWFPWPLLLLGALVVWLTTRGDRPPPQPPAPWGEGETLPPGMRAGGPPTVTYVPPPPRPTGVVLFWPTLALVAITLGVVGLVDVQQELPVSTYAAATLAVVGLALLLGAFRGRPGGLIALGLAASLGLGVTTAVDAVDAGGPYREVVLTPTSATGVDGVASDYRVDSGDFELDLRQVSDLDRLDGRTVRVEMPAGELSVVLPDDLNAEVDGRVRYAGEVRVEGRVGTGGIGERAASDSVVNDPAGPTVRLDLDLGVGAIDVTTR